MNSHSKLSEDNKQHTIGLMCFIQTQKKREEFMQALKDTLNEDHDGEKYGTLTKKNTQGYLDAQDRLTMEFKDELREWKQEEYLNLEESLANARQACDDIFGIKRRFCNVCEQGCIGYEPHKIMFPSHKHNQFPTFCKNCSCPAHFHQVTISNQDIKFPEDLGNTIKNFNISSKDLNFNCILTAFQVRDVDKETSNMNELMTILKEEGLEILSYEKRCLEFEEAIYLKSRMIGQTENLLFDSHTEGARQYSKHADIKKDGRLGTTTIDKHAKRDTYLLERYTSQKEAFLQKTQQKLMGQKANLVNPIEGVTLPKAQQQKTLKEESFNQRAVSFNEKNASIARTSVVSEFDELQMMPQFSRKTSVMPKPKQQTFKMKTYSKTKTTKKSSMLPTIPEEAQESYLTKELEMNPLLRELIVKEVLFLAVGSSTYQNLETKLRSSVMQKLQQFLPPQEMPLLYISDNKIMAIEDCITFFPQLFRLTKSVIVSEPIQEYNPDGQSEYHDSIQGENTQLQELKEKIAKMSGTGMDDMVYEAIETEEGGDNHYSKKRNTLTKKLSTMSRKSLKKRESVKQVNETQLTDMSWAERARTRESKLKKQSKLVYRKNKLLYNFGVMQDFFNYSAMTIQSALKEIDITNPKASAVTQQLQNVTQVQLNKSNIFAIAKVGLPNLIFPNSLDVKFSNYQHFSSYLYLCDQFFPTISHQQFTVVVLRPLIVKNVLNDLFVQILKANDFVVVKRKIRMLKKSEVSYLSRIEGISQDNAELYYNMMMGGESEILVLSKLGAVHDAISIVNGANPFGRRRVAMLFEDQSSVRSNVDSVNSMFEITPFTSFNEFIDLEDFMVSHSKLEKYKKLYKSGRQGDNINRLDDILYFSKIEQIRKELNVFSRFFNLAAVAAPTEYEAHKQMCILAPETATIEEVVLILNPLYNNFLESATKLLLRMGFKVMEHKFTVFREAMVKQIFKEKLAQWDDLRLTEMLTNTHVHCWHLSKISADREVRQHFIESQIDYEDLFSVKITKTPFKPMHLPMLFLFMDTAYMFEHSLNLIWPKQLIEITGQDLVDKLSNKEKLTVLENTLILTAGDKIKQLYYDRKGQIMQEPKTEDQQDLAKHLIGQKEPQILLLYSNPKDSSAVHYVVESETHGLFEIRYHRLSHKGDSLNLCIDPASVNIGGLKMRYFTKFQVLNFYYNEVNKHFYNICPAFYRFKICPLIGGDEEGSNTLNRVYEVEEYMGRSFMEEIANMHQDHIKMIKNQKRVLSWQHISEQEQKSLPAYIWGLRFADMCKNLESIRGNDPQYMTGAGRIQFKDNHLKGEVPKPSQYFEFDKKRYMKYLNEFKKGWHYYLSVLETDIIEQKLMHILNSFTYKYSRLPQFLSLIPDKVQEINLRINEKVKVLTEFGLQQNKEKFFTHLKEGLIDPHREEHASTQVQSLMHTLLVQNIREKVEKKLNKEGTSVDEVIHKDEKQKYSIHKDCAIVGVDVARRPKHQLFASILYLVNFWLRKIERRTDMFVEHEKQLNDIDDEAERDYDQILDIIFKSMTDNYGDDEYNYALDMLSLQRGYETEFEKRMREKTEMEEKIRERMKQIIYEEQRTMRTTMKMDELLQTQCHMPQREYEMKQRNLLKKYVETKGHLDKEGDGFMQVLKETQSFIGAYSIKLAHDYINRSEQERKTGQEKISLVKMEYFLYGIKEAYTSIQALKHLEERVNQMHDQFEIMKKEVLQNESSYNRQNTQSQKRSEDLFQFERQIERLRYTISMKETELVLIFRELMSWDYFVPDHYFDTQLMLQKQKTDKGKETFLLPLKTFWRQVEVDDPYEDDLFHENYHVRLRDYKLEPPEDLLPAALCRQPYSKLEQSWRLQQGLTVSNLRPHDYVEPAAKVKFDKFTSLGEMKQIGELRNIKETIKHKTTKEPYRPDHPF